jgi:protein involved in polysaccharide export with SLBB domain
MRKFMKTWTKYLIVIALLYLTNNVMVEAQSTNAGMSSFNQIQMTQTQKISVSVTGAVKNPGTYVLDATDRANRALEMANQNDRLSNQLNKTDKMIQDEKDLPHTEKVDPDDISTLDVKEKPRRNIILYRRKGEVLKVDIQKYYTTRDESWNPYLSNGDIIFVPRFEEKKNIYAVYGGVNVPGQIEYSEGDRISDAILLAYGFTSRAIVDSIILYRYSDDNQSIREQVLNWTRLQNNVETNIPLHPGDRIVVPERSDLREDYNVSVSGEVYFPGIYPITREYTKLSTIIHNAGGTTPYASLKSAIIYRNDITQKELPLERMMRIRGNTLIEDTANLYMENELRLRRSVVNVDFEKLLVNQDTLQDVVLHSGDKIIVPSIAKTVYVYGQVFVPGSITFAKNKDANYYIQKAGGYTEHARNKDIMIIKRATRQWLSPKETEIEEGDYIWVPKEPERSSAYYWTLIGQMASVISVAVSIVILAVQLKK